MLRPARSRTVDYIDASCKRRLKMFRRKRDADIFYTTTAAELRAGTHAADRASTTIAKAGELWLAECEKRGLERSSLAHNRRNLSLSGVPLRGVARVLFTGQ
jgi:hypothetical protein